MIVTVGDGLTGDFREVVGNTESLCCCEYTEETVTLLEEGRTSVNNN